MVVPWNLCGACTKNGSTLEPIHPEVVPKCSELVGSMEPQFVNLTLSNNAS